MTPALRSFAYNLDYLRAQVADVEPADMVAQPPGVPNHPAWTLGHLTYSCQKLGSCIGLEPWLAPEYRQKHAGQSVPVADIRAYDSKVVALGRLADGQQRITRAIEALNDGELDAPLPDPTYLRHFTTVRLALTQVLVGHTAFHVGQISVWRRAMGLPAPPRVFE